MTPRLDFDDLVNILFENACTDFHKTEQYKLLYEKRNRMDNDCKAILTSDDQDFVEDCFEILLDFCNAETEFVYRQGFRDCVAILKKLEVI